MKEWKSNAKVWFLHTIDHLIWFSASCVIKMKWKEKTIKQVFIILVPIFGSLKKFLIDNSGEFINWEFCSLCENVNICILTTAAELLWKQFDRKAQCNCRLYCYKNNIGCLLWPWTCFIIDSGSKQLPKIHKWLLSKPTCFQGKLKLSNCFKLKVTSIRRTIIQWGWCK